MTPRERLFTLELFGIKLGLDNIRTLVDALDRPDRAWAAVHVAGTNGKGSVTAMVERGLRAAGHRTGRYTSPHLASIEERVALDGRSVDAVTFDQAAADVLAVVDRLRASGKLQAPPTFFETTTAIAFEIFRQHNVEVAVIEVGLGGRFDATNVISPLVSTITSVAMDHERHLGRTLSAIAFEKAGIVKPGVPVVVAAQAPDAGAVIADRATREGAPLVSAGAEHVASLTLTRGRASVELDTPVRRYPSITLALNGAHQVANAVVAARTLETCNARGVAAGEAAVVAALSDVEWPARLEWLRLPAGRHVLIDAAHNPAGARALAAYLTDAGATPIALVLAVMKDKDVDAMLGAIAPSLSMLVATEVESARALSAHVLADRARHWLPEDRVAVRLDWNEALELAFTNQVRVCVAGSIFLAGPMRAHLVAGGAETVAHPW